jgi:hypothetical protein
LTAYFKSAQITGMFITAIGVLIGREGFRGWTHQFEGSWTRQCNRPIQDQETYSIEKTDERLLW